MRKGILIIVFVILGVLSGLFVNSFRSNSQTPSTPRHITTPTPAIASPQRLVIDKLGINADVEEVALTTTGAMDVPKAWENVGWYKLGAKPGETGNAVIAGHLDSPTAPAVFYKLNQLELGDIITVQDTTGQKRNFKVVDKQTYPDAGFPLELVFGRTDKKRLNLITCQGSFNQSTKLYSHRLVVFTEPI